MFFSPDLLAKRDHGFGLLWLAATLGSKSAFKKLPKRSIQTADISELCELVADPAEPLALRLTSNLMFGVVRIFKVKQEIFMTDVTNFVASLKKAEQELKATAIVNVELQMVQPTVRRSAITVDSDPKSAYAIDFDALVADWDEYLNIGDKSLGSSGEGDGEDPDINLKGGPGKQKLKTKRALSPGAIRRDMHTLSEHHEHLLSASFELSFNGSGEAGFDLSSSQVEPAFLFDDNLFALSDGAEIGGFLGEDLERELGWVLPSEGERRGAEFENDFQFILGNEKAGIPMDVVGRVFDVEPMDVEVTDIEIPQINEPHPDSDKENIRPTPTGEPVLVDASQASSATSFSRLLLSQDIECEKLQPEPTNNGVNPANKNSGRRLLLDLITELSDEELKIGRSQYVESQSSLKQKIQYKTHEKSSGKLIEDLIWRVPDGIVSHALIEFWQLNLKVKVAARSGTLLTHEERPAKRRKVLSSHNGEEGGEHERVALVLDIEQPQDEVIPAWEEYHNDENLPYELADRRSSEEPGQARRLSRAASAIGGSYFDLDQGRNDQRVNEFGGSQKSSLFPWDDAGPTSSSGVIPIGSGDNNFDEVDIRLRSSSFPSRRESSLIPSQLESITRENGFSPPVVGKGLHAMDEDFVFQIESLNPLEEQAAQRSLKSDLNAAALERSSLNFLEYAKLFNQSLPIPGPNLSFETIVPQTTSTRHVAAAAFYHCLVLATRSLLALHQYAAYQPISITMI